MNATDGSTRLHFSRLRRGKTPLEEQGLCAAKFILRCTQHTLLFAQMQIHFAREGHHTIPKDSGFKPDRCQAFYECRNSI